MLKISLAAVSIGLLAAAPAVARGEVIGNDMARCATGAGPAVLVELSGFKTVSGKVRVQSYPATRAAWLEKGAWINRVEVPVKSGFVRVCMPLPAAGRYGIAVRHDANGNGKTDFSSDGGGFSNNPKLSIFNLGKPSVDKVAINAGRGVSTISIRLQYM
jgi:uncharacterized protein (DUF2141 family)